MTEAQLEQETLAWLQDVGYPHLYATVSRAVRAAAIESGELKWGLLWI